MTIAGIELPAAALIAAVSALIAFCGLVIGWSQWRERQFRKDDVLKWANEAIRNLQSLYLLCALGESVVDAAAGRAKRQQIALDSSVLVEQGRLFFRNVSDASHGQDKFAAYRGYRPEVLDPLVVAHQIACGWDAADEAARARMTMVAEDCVKRFVSFAQMEVGRTRTISREVAKGGAGPSLSELMERVSAQRLSAASAVAQASGSVVKSSG